MIIMRGDATDEQIANVIQEVTHCGLRATLSASESRTVIDLVGDEGQVPYPQIAVLPGVQEAARVQTPYKLINRKYASYSGNSLENKFECAKDIVLGGDTPVFIAGPCAVESEYQVMKIAEGVKQAGAHILRGGVFKPRSSVHSFQGLGALDLHKAEEALKWLQSAGHQHNMPVITEVRGESQLDLIAEYADILQIGSRNMYDQDLLIAVARKNKPVLFKRHFGASIEEFLSFAEYLAAEKNKHIILCERGLLPVGKGNNYTRYLLDLGSVPVLKNETYLPVIVDPSHAMGRADLIFNMSCAAVAAGADGLMIETHYNPDEALVDGKQMITPRELQRVIDACNNIHSMISSASNQKN